MINRVVLQNFRCHNNFSLNIDNSPLFITGENGKGKTSIIEAVYLALTLRTFRKHSLSEIVHFGDNFLRIIVNFSESDLSELVYFFNGKRRVLLDGIDSISAAELAFLYPVLCYSPHFETILSPEQAERRSFLDRVF
jgi:DNA replication and repair protein RecF